MVNTLADAVDTMEQDQPILQPAKGQQMRDYTPVPQRLAPHPWPHTPEPHPPP